MTGVADAWIGSNATDVTIYVRSVPMIRGLAANLRAWALIGRMVSTITEQ